MLYFLIENQGLVARKEIAGLLEKEKYDFARIKVFLKPW